MKNQQSGFTLIELVAVIVILGILAATALPKFVDMSSAAKQAAVDGIAGNLGSAMALNYAAAVAYSAGLSGAVSATSITTCAAGSSLLVGGLPGASNTPADFVITGTFSGSPTQGSSTTCTLTAKTGKVATFSGVYVP